MILWHFFVTNHLMNPNGAHLWEVFSIVDLMSQIYTQYFCAKILRLKDIFQAIFFSLCELKRFIAVYLKWFWNVTTIFWRKHLISSKDYTDVLRMVKLGFNVQKMDNVGWGKGGSCYFPYKNSWYICKVK